MKLREIFNVIAKCKTQNSIVQHMSTKTNIGRSSSCQPTKLIQNQYVFHSHRDNPFGSVVEIGMQVCVCVCV